MYAASAKMGLNISSAHPMGVYFVGVLAVRQIVETVTNFRVGSQIWKNGFEVGVVGIINGVITDIIITFIAVLQLGGGLRYKYNKDAKK